MYEGVFPQKKCMDDCLYGWELGHLVVAFFFVTNRMLKYNKCRYKQAQELTINKMYSIKSLVAFYIKCRATSCTSCWSDLIWYNGIVMKAVTYAWITNSINPFLLRIKTRNKASTVSTDTAVASGRKPPDNWRFEEKCWVWMNYFFFLSNSKRHVF